MSGAMPFLSDNAAPVHPQVWDALRAADTAQPPYDGDALSGALDDAFGTLFGRECTALWMATGTAANGLALACLVPPYGAAVCHRGAHVQNDEGGAPGFYTHGAGLLLADGPSAKLTPDSIAGVLDSIRPDVHRTHPTAIAVTQASELGATYRPEELSALSTFADERGLAVHMDGARFGNAVAFLGCAPADAGPAHGIASLAFGFVKNGAMNAEALVLFDPALAEPARNYRKRAGHLQSKGRFLAAQILAMLKDDLWLANARAANAAAAEIAAAVPDRLAHPVEANEIFVRVDPRERERLRAAGFVFYDWTKDTARFVTAWDAREDEVRALAAALAAL